MEAVSSGCLAAGRPSSWQPSSAWPAGSARSSWARSWEIPTQSTSQAGHCSGNGPMGNENGRPASKGRQRNFGKNHPSPGMCFFLPFFKGEWAVNTQLKKEKVKTFLNTEPCSQLKVDTKEICRWAPMRVWREVYMQVIWVHNSILDVETVPTCPAKTRLQSNVRVHH